MVVEEDPLFCVAECLLVFIKGSFWVIILLLDCIVIELFLQSWVHVLNLMSLSFEDRSVLFRFCTAPLTLKFSEYYLFFM